MITPVDMVKMLLSGANVVYFEVEAFDNASATFKLLASGNYIKVYVNKNDELDHIRLYDGSIPRQRYFEFDEFAERMHLI